MKFNHLKIEGVYEIIPEPIVDSRGFFLRSYDVSAFKEMGLHREWAISSRTFSTDDCRHDR